MIANMATELIGYRREYRIRLAQGDRVKSAEVTFPYEVVDREARRRGLTIAEFLEQFHVVAQFDGFDGVLYTFEPLER